MTQVIEPAFMAPPPQEKKEKKKEKEPETTTVRFSVFFDGTLNNRANVEQRIASTDDDDLQDDEKKDRERIKNEMSAEDQEAAQEVYDDYGGGETSYEGYFTNVEKMERYVNKAKDFKHSFTTYIEGPGTDNKDEDKTLGYAFGTSAKILGSNTGVIAKVGDALDKIIKKIKKDVKSTELIEKLVLDVFGFSRGASGARYFIYKAIRDDKKIKNQLEDAGYKVKKVEIHFAGLYDTVSSYGYLIMIDANNVKRLKLDAVRLVKKKVVHLAASDEHREYFSLTNINSAGKKKGLEIFLPGVHSDIGGGYSDNVSEDFAIYRGTESRAKEEQIKFIESGWFNNVKELELETRYRRVGKTGRRKEGILKASRDKISNKYSNISLHIMANEARDNSINIKGQLEVDEDIPYKLSNIKGAIDKYISSKVNGGSKSSDWIEGGEQWKKYEMLIKEIRNSFLHYSARLQTGHAPRTGAGYDERYRIEYNG